MTDELPPESLDSLAERFGETPRSPTPPVPSVPNLPIRCGYKHISTQVSPLMQTSTPWSLNVSYYDASLQLLQAQGFKRHLSQWEALSIINDGNKGTLPKQFQDVYDSMVRTDNPGEWLSLAFARVNNTLRVYCIDNGHNATCVWNGKGYVGARGLHDGPQFHGVVECDISCFPPGRPIGLHEFPDTFVHFIWGRCYKDIAVGLRGNKELNVYLPPEGVVWPVARGNDTLGERYCLIGGPVHTASGKFAGHMAATRGIK